MSEVTLDQKRQEIINYLIKNVDEAPETVKPAIEILASNIAKVDELGESLKHLEQSMSEAQGALIEARGACMSAGDIAVKLLGDGDLLNDMWGKVSAPKEGPEPKEESTPEEEGK